MNLQEWRERQRKTVVCPSGATAVYRKLNAGDALCLMGAVPGLNVERRTTHTETEGPKEQADSIRLYMTRGVVSFCEAKVVDKPEGECSEGEVSYLEIPTEDMNFLMVKIAEVTNPKIEKTEDGASLADARFSQERVGTADA